MIRMFDILFSLAGILVVAPCLPLLVLAIKIDSPGPVFCKVERLGRNRSKFHMLKFRTMHDICSDIGGSLCPQYDPRVTRVGRLLRRTKINELPQLLNILRGEMTFVGPRPEAPDLGHLYEGKDNRIFDVKPGLIGPASILGRNEEECYPTGVDARAFYAQHLLPIKIKFDLQFIDTPNLKNYFKYIGLGVYATITGIISRKHIRRNLYSILLAVFDAFAANLSYLSAVYLLNYNLGKAGYFQMVSILIPLRAIVNFCFGIYNAIRYHMSHHDLVQIWKAAFYGTVLVSFTAAVFGLNGYTFQLAVVDFCILAIALSLSRINLSWMRRTCPIDKRQRAFIYGVTKEGGLIFDMTSRNMEIVGFLDDDMALYGKSFCGKKILGNLYHLPALAKLHNVQRVFICERDEDLKSRFEIATLCLKANVQCDLVPFRSDWLHMDGAVGNMRRPAKQTLTEVSHDLFGKTVLMSGAFGTVGPKLISSMLKRGCKRVVVLDNYASQLSALLEKASMDSGKEKIIPVLGGWNWEQQAEQAFRDYAPQIVLQTATRKYLLPHVPPDLEFIQRSNFSRSFKLAQLAMANQAEIFCIISSHEAGNGNNPISSSLKQMEDELIARFSGSEKTKLAIVRVCDVYENSPDYLTRIKDASSSFRQVKSAAPVKAVQLISMDTAIESILRIIVDKIEAKTKKSLFEIEPIKLSADDGKSLTDIVAYS